MIIGDPVEHSLSPQMHNSAYTKLGIDQEFVYIASRVMPKNLKRAIDGIRALGIKGVTITIPHKEAVLPYLDGIDETAEKISAVNTILNRDNKLIGINTDWIGVVTPLEKITTLQGKNVAVIGAGGFAHAATYAVVSKGAKVKIYNRTVEHAKTLANKFDCDFGSLKDVTEVKNADIIINATSVGMEEEKAIIEKKLMQKRQIVFDAVYVPYETTLIKEAKEQGATVIHGTELLLYQGVAQFELFTGVKAPVETMREVIMENISL